VIALVDYGLGNIQAFANIFRRLGLPVVSARTPEELGSATKIVLPGVGAFDWAMRKLDESGMRQMLDDMVLRRGINVLGVCVGMQMMARRSDEGELPGLGWIDAEVRRFSANSSGHELPQPHMGWNDATPTSTDDLFRGMSAPRFYFLHSYYFVPAHSQDTLATTNYGISFVSAVRAGNVYGTQFHPEKSHDWGVQLLRNFAEI